MNNTLKTSSLLSARDSMIQRKLVNTEESCGIQDEINSRNGVFRPITPTTKGGKINLTKRRRNMRIKRNNKKSKRRKSQTKL